MKCKNCGSNYPTRQLQCPYCGTENFLGKIWQREISDAEKEFDAARKASGKAIFSPYTLNRIVSRVLVVLVGLYILLFVGVFAFFFLQEGFRKIYVFVRHDHIEETMEEYYNNGEFEKLDAYMNQYEIGTEDEYYAYTQVTLLNYDYNEYLNMKMSFMDLSEEEKQEDSYYLEYILKYAQDILSHNQGIYSRLDVRNEAIYEEYCSKIKPFLLGTLQMDEEDYERLTSAEYIYSDEHEQMMDEIKERKGWLQ